MKREWRLVSRDFSLEIRPGVCLDVCYSGSFVYDGNNRSPTKVECRSLDTKVIAPLPDCS